MQLRADQLARHLQAGLRPLYLVHGDEPLLVQEACDAIRAAARAAGCSERSLHVLAGAHPDWSSFLGESQSLSLFAERRLIELRLPGGKPGKEGGEALQRLAAHLDGQNVHLVVLPRLDRQQQSSAWFTALEAAGISLRIDPIERTALPAWLAQRLAAQGQRVEAGEAGAHTLAFFADRVEGNLLAAHQELQKLALLHPAGELRAEQVREAVLNVARYDVFKLGEAVWAGQTARVLRMLEGLQAEGEGAVLVHWTLADDLRGLARLRALLDEGKPWPMAVREARIWGTKERLFQSLLPGLDGRRLAALLSAASACDGVVKGLRQPGWPSDPWAALRRLALMLVDAGRPVGRRRPALVLEVGVPAAAG